jgi:hypothetical protein
MKEFNGDTDELLEKIEYVLVRAKEFEKEIKMCSENYIINTLNVGDENIISALSNKYICADLGYINLDKMISNLR